MIIHPPEIQSHRGRWRLQARVEFQTAGLCVPDRIWIDYPGEYQPEPRADGFAAALLLVAMSLGEALEVRGAVCPNLAYGLEQLQETMLDSHPQVFCRIAVRYEDLSQAVVSSGPRRVLQTFSGGVDSFFTLRQHGAGGALHDLMPVTHALFVHGFDVPLFDHVGFQSMTAVYEPLLRSLGVELLPVRTNLRELTREVNWEISHGTALAGVAHGLGAGVRHLLVAASSKYSAPFLWGSDPRLDHWLSSACMRVVHYGAHLTRLERLIAMGDWEPIRKALRVCWVKPDGVMNCCRCTKCLLTLAGLQIIGDPKQFETFPLPYERRRMRAARFEGVANCENAEIALRLARQHGKEELAADLEYALRRTRRR